MDILDNSEIYRNRVCRAYNQLDDRHFSWRNYCSIGVFLLADAGGYCLDAPEQMPAGSMKGYGRHPDTAWTDMSLTERETLALTPEELGRRNALAERLIAEILAEENA